MNEEIKKWTMYTSSVQGVASTGSAAATETKAFTFNPSNTPIRVQVINQEPWFVAKDVCDALTIEKHRDAVSRLDDDERGSVVVDTLGGKQAVAAVNESGLYNLIFQSRKPEAKVFRKWVTGEVLPSIRKTGSYSVSQHGEYVVIPEHVKKQWLARAEESAYRRFRLEGCKEMVVAIHGVQPVVFEGGLWYNYAEAVRALGGKKADSSKRKRKYPQHFKLIYGRNFITAAFFRLLEEYYRYRQAEINFTAEEGGELC